MSSSTCTRRMAYLNSNVMALDGWMALPGTFAVCRCDLTVSIRSRQQAGHASDCPHWYRIWSWRRTLQEKRVAPVYCKLFGRSDPSINIVASKWYATGLRLSALMDLYIHPLYVLVSKILSSILNSPAPIHPLYHPLSTLSTVGPTCYFI
jgi:hypothetical protein